MRAYTIKTLKNGASALSSVEIPEDVPEALRVMQREVGGPIEFLRTVRIAGPHAPGGATEVTLWVNESGLLEDLAANHGARALLSRILDERSPEGAPRIDPVVGPMILEGHRTDFATGEVIRAELPSDFPDRIVRVLESIVPVEAI